MEAPLTILVLVVTGLVTVRGFQRPDLRERWMLNPRAVLAHQQYDRMLMSGLIHADVPHFLFNALSFYFFGSTVETTHGTVTLLAIYLTSILGGSVLSLIIHRGHEYQALGASGGVCGVIFASIFLLPGEGVSLFMLPIYIPAWLYAIGFLVGSFVAHRRRRDHIGHDAHLGGAIAGLLVATAMYPHLIFAAPWMFATVMGLSLLILYLLIKDPLHLLERTLFKESPITGGDERTREYEENRVRRLKKEEIDRLLDKVASGGMKSLSASERRKLEELSGKVYGRQ